MKRNLAVSSSLPAILLLALAPINPLQAGEIIGGVKAGVVDIDASGYDQITVASLQIGYEFADLVAMDVAIEGEFTQSVYDADGPSGDYDYRSFGLFASLRSTGPVYLIARIGVAEIRLDEDSGNTSDSGFAYGLGIGFSTGIRWELEWNVYDYKDDKVNHIALHLSF